MIRPHPTAWPLSFPAPVRARWGERGIWQRQFWEHLIRDEVDFQAHMDYVHINAVKHHLVKRAAQCPSVIAPYPGSVRQCPRKGRDFVRS